MKLSITFLVSLFTTATLVIILILAVLVYNQTINQISTSESFSHNYKIVYELNALRSAMWRLEYAPFPIDRSNKESVQDYKNILLSVENHYANLVSLIQYDGYKGSLYLKELEPRMLRLIQYAQEYSTFTNEVEPVGRESNKTASAKYVDSAQIRKILFDIEFDQIKLFDVRRAVFEKASQNLKKGVLCLAIIPLSLVLIILILVRFYEKDRTRSESGLKAAKYKFSGIFNQSFQSIFLLDTSGLVLDINDTGLTQMGLNRKDIIGQSIWQANWWQNSEAAVNQLKDAILRALEGEQVQFESDLKNPDGHLIHVDFSIKGVTQEDGSILYLIAELHEITAIKLAERRSLAQYSITKALAQPESVIDASHRMLESLGQNLGWQAGALWLYNEATDRLEFVQEWHESPWAQENFRELFGSKVDPAETSYGNVYSENAPLWINSRPSENSRQCFPKEAIEQGLKTAVAVPLRKEDEAVGVIEMYNKECLEPDLDLLRLLDAIGRQFGQFLERIKIDQNLKEREKLFSQLADNVKEVFWIASPNLDRCFYVSPAYEQIWMRPREEVYRSIGSVLKSILPEDRLKAKQHLENVPDSGSETEYRISRADGEIRWISARSFPILDEKGKVIRLCGIAHDITERKLVEKRVSEFYSTVSHELRTPLTSIRAALGIIEGGLAGVLTDKTAQLVHIARRESDRLIRLINDILDIRKIEAGKLELKIEPIMVKELINLALNGLQAMAHECQVQLKSGVVCGTIVFCDQDRMVQVLTNLISNAIKFSPVSSEVIVEAERAENSVRFSVKDRGPGIPQNQLHKLFGVFQQLDSSDSRRKGGTGLGLAISKWIVEQHHGHIGVNSELGSGSEFWFDLPLPVNGNETSSSESPYFGARVLIVENDEQLAKMLQEILMAKGYQIAIAGSIKKADELIVAFKPRAIILDLMLPDGNGLEWMKRLKESSTEVDIPIIVTTGGESKAGDYGYPRLIDWLVKPFDEKKLLSALSTAVGSRANTRAKVLVIDDDSATRHIITHQLMELGVTCIEADDGVKAIELARLENPDLIILDVGLPYQDGFDVVQVLRQEQSKNTPLIVYTSRDISKEDMQRLTLGLTRHLVKSRTPQSAFLMAVKDMLDGLIAPIASSTVHK